jgi:hypothetical protein
MTPWLSLVIPTAGQRPEGLCRTLESVHHQPSAVRDGVELLGVADTHALVDRTRFDRLQAELGPCRWLEHDAGVHCYGQPQRTFGAQQALGEWVGFSQDDNILSADALTAVWFEVCQSPHKRPLFFKVLTPWREQIWRERSLYQSNIDADCLVLPRDLARGVTWGLRYEGDFDAAVSATHRAQGDVGWCEEQIALARPDAEHVWWQ